MAVGGLAVALLYGAGSLRSAFGHGQRSVPSTPRAVIDAAVELSRAAQQNPKKQGNRALWFILSVAAFVAVTAGGGETSWVTIVMLVGVLFAHELGHYLAMRAFGFRDVKISE